MSKKIPSRNKSPTGWWIASYIERLVWHDIPDTPEVRCVAWENTLILKAKTRNGAYTKAVRLARSGGEFWDADDRNRTGHFEFEGLTSLLPIFEDLEDGAEIMWVEHRNRKLKTIQSLVKEKHELEVFLDDE